jgi:hypothetical protein
VDFVWYLLWTAIIFLNSINQLIFVIVKCGVLFEVRTELLSIIYASFCFKRLKDSFLSFLFLLPLEINYWLHNLLRTDRFTKWFINQKNRFSYKQLLLYFFACNKISWYVKFLFTFTVTRYECSYSEPGSSFGTVSGYELDDRAIELRSPTEAKRFFLQPLCPDRLWGPPNQWVPGVLSRGLKRGQGVTLITHPHLVPRSRMSRSYISSAPKRLRGM